MIYVYSDGASTGRIGPGGYAWIVVKDDVDVICAGYGHNPVTTNNVMELMGAIEGLDYVIQAGLCDDITLVSDSQYVLDLATGKNTPQKNVELALKIRSYAIMLNLHTKWVRGHSGDPFNMCADSMAVMAKVGYHKSTSAKRAEKKRRQEIIKAAATADVSNG